MIMINTEENTPVPDLPVLSPALLLSYSSLPSNMQRLFIKVFRYLWGVVLPVKRFKCPAGLLYSFWVVDLLRERLSLTTTELSLITYIYQMTDNNSKYIHSDLIYNSMVLSHILPDSKMKRLTDLNADGYIIRSTSDPFALHLRCSHSRQPVFIKLSVKGVQVIESMGKDMHKILFNTSLNDLTGANKKPG